MGDMLGGGNIFSAVRYEGIRENLTHVKVGELCNETSVMNREIVAAITGIPLTAVEYGKLRDMQYKVFNREIQASVGNEGKREKHCGMDCPNQKGKQ